MNGEARWVCVLVALGVIACAFFSAGYAPLDSCAVGVSGPQLSGAASDPEEAPVTLRGIVDRREGGLWQVHFVTGGNCWLELLEAQTPRWLSEGTGIELGVAACPEVAAHLRAAVEARQERLLGRSAGGAVALGRP